MPTFRYKALQTDGAVAEGQLEASGRPDAFRQMEGLGLRPVSLSEGATTEKKAGPSLGNLGDFSFKLQSQRVSAKALENFTRLLSSLLAAGVSFEPGTRHPLLGSLHAGRGGEMEGDPRPGD